MKIIAIFILLTLVSCKQEPISFQVKDSQNFKFLVAGHAYGSHDGKNLGLYPKFLKKLKSADHHKADFLILNGDMLRVSDKQSWGQMEKEIISINVPTFYVMGNHDDSEYGINKFKDRYKETYYHFNIGKNLFIMLDIPKGGVSLSNDQLSFLEDVLKNKAKNVFIFMHEMIWNGGNKRYSKLKPNNRSRAKRLKDKSNFWSEIFPILKSHKGKNINVFAGDLAGRKDAIAAFFDQVDNIKLIGSGMGEVIEENYLEVSVSNEIEFKLIPLNNVKINKLEEYTVEFYKKNN